MTHVERFARVLWYALATPGTHVPAVYSNPGGGKTTVAAAVSRALGILPEHHYVMAAAQRAVEDFGGWGVPRAEGLEMEPTAEIRRLSKAPKAMIVFDEAGNADRAHQAAMLRVLHERCFGDHRLPDTVMLMVITNPPGTGTDPQEFAKAFSNRVVWIRYPALERSEHAAYIRSRGQAEFGFPSWDQAAWDREYDKVAAVYSAFMERHPAAVLEEDPESDEVCERWPVAYATGRSWETAVRLAATCRVHDDDDAMLNLLEGAVGKPQAVAFCAAMQELDIVPFDDVMANPACWEPRPGRPDRTFAQVQYVVACGTDPSVKDRKERIARWDAALRFVGRVAETGEPMSLCVPAAQALRDKQPPGASITHHLDVVAALEPVINAAGWAVDARRSPR